MVDTVSKQTIANILFETIDEVNETLPEGNQLTKTLETALFGESRTLDSVSLVHLIIATEQRMEEEFDVTVTLADERAMSQSRSPFLTCETLVDYIYMLLTETSDA